jgi:hypothetical protein
MTCIASRRVIQLDEMQLDGMGCEVVLFRTKVLESWLLQFSLSNR